MTTPTQAHDPILTVANVRRAYGDRMAALAEKGHWPDAERVRQRLALIAQHGVRKGRQVARAGQRIEARLRAERLRGRY